VPLEPKTPGKCRDELTRWTAAFQTQVRFPNGLSLRATDWYAFMNSKASTRKDRLSIGLFSPHYEMPLWFPFEVRLIIAYVHSS
jgi:hypothetical protein